MQKYPLEISMGMGVINYADYEYVIFIDQKLILPWVIIELLFSHNIPGLFLAKISLISKIVRVSSNLHRNVKRRLNTCGWKRNLHIHFERRFDCWGCREIFINLSLVVKSLLVMPWIYNIWHESYILLRINILNYSPLKCIYLNMTEINSYVIIDFEHTQWKLFEHHLKYVLAFF